MKRKNHTVSQRQILGYEYKKQLYNGYKVLEYFTNGNDGEVRKRTVAKNLSVTDAEDTVYRLERKHFK